jgi:DNA repair protein RadA/Sms
LSKNKAIYRCQSCGAQFHQWAGQCLECGSWNSIVEEVVKVGTRGSSQYAGQNSSVVLLKDIALDSIARLSLDQGELDRVLGGGLVPGSVVLIGGDPGIGKSTLLLQAMAMLPPSDAPLYVTGEESLQQVTLRAHRLELQLEHLKLLAHTHVETILQIAAKDKPKVMVIDSIQTMYTDTLQSAAGGVGQVRESAAQLVRFAKESGTSLFLVGHVTKEGALAGPRVLEHMVDTVLYFETEHDSRYRMIRASKNRFGTVNELGLFAMTEKGLRGVHNPSALFLSGFRADVPGSVVMATWEGTRPMLVEVQALVDESPLANPRRVTLGLDSNRLNMLLAVLHKQGNIACYNQDVFVNLVGGIKMTETAADIAILLAVVSSLKERPLPHDLIVFGEVGLSGEIRPVQYGQERLKEAAKLGFKRAIVPKANQAKQSLDIEVLPVSHLREVLEYV